MRWCIELFFHRAACVRPPQRPNLVSFTWKFHPADGLKLVATVRVADAAIPNRSSGAGNNIFA
jgi:hypothetical protein